MMKYIKLLVIYACRLVLKIFWLVPLKKNRVYFSADRGSGIRCNPMYIYRYLQSNYADQLQYIWQFDGKAEGVNTVCVKPGSLKDIYYQLTAKVLISNDGFGSFLPKRKKQMMINTWHGGGAYKRSGTDFIADQNPVELKINRICGRQTDVFLSGCSKFSEVMSGAKFIALEKFLECGMPRNDLLINGTEEDLRTKVLTYFHLSPNVKLILFAPTYRGEEQEAAFRSELDTAACCDALNTRFGGEWVVLMRKHHFVKSTDIGNCIDASDYPDMQELLYVVDAFITDYSSTIWDFSFTYKPAFLFAPDYQQYATERSFYTDPKTWSFDLATSNEQLCKLILNYDEQQAKEKINRHLSDLGNKECGKATQTVSEKIMKFISE